MQISHRLCCIDVLKNEGKIFPTLIIFQFCLLLRLTMPPCGTVLCEKTLIESGPAIVRFLLQGLVDSTVVLIRSRRRGTWPIQCLLERGSHPVTKDSVSSPPPLSTHPPDSASSIVCCSLLGYSHIGKCRAWLSWHCVFELSTTPSSSPASSLSSSSFYTPPPSSCCFVPPQHNTTNTTRVPSLRHAYSHFTQMPIHPSFPSFS